MFIKSILANIDGCKRIDIMAFEGTKEEFFSCFEIITSKNKQYLFNFEVTKNGNEVRIDLKISGIKKEFKNTVNSIIQTLRAFYVTEYGNDITFRINKRYLINELIMDVLNLKSRI